MDDYRFGGLEETYKKSIQNEQIYREYGQDSYYKKDYSGNKIKCDLNGNSIPNYNSTDSNSSGIEIILVALMSIVVAVGLVFVASDWSKDRLILLSILFIISTIIIPILTYMGSLIDRFSFVDIIKLCVSIINIFITIFFGFSLIYNFMFKVIKIDSDDFIFTSLVPIILGFIAVKLVQKLIWSIIYKKFKISIEKKEESKGNHELF